MNVFEEATNKVDIDTIAILPNATLAGDMCARAFEGNPEAIYAVIKWYKCCPPVNAVRASKIDVKIMNHINITYHKIKEKWDMN